VIVWWLQARGLSPSLHVDLGVKAGT